MNLNLDQPFVSCSVCHETGKNQSLYLTSCAHILCKEHASRHAQNPGNLEHTKTRCVACNHDYVTIVKLDNRLPDDIRPFLTPFPTQVEQFFAVTQFQYCGMAERIQHQQQMMQQMEQKIKKQKSLLLLAKESVAKVESLERKIQELEQENEALRASASFGNRIPVNQIRPSTIDLTANESFEESPHQQIQDNRRHVSNSFVNQVKQSSQQKTVQSKPYISPLRVVPLHHHQQQQEHQVQMDSLDFGKGRIAESTNILANTPVRQMPIRRSLDPPSSHSSTGGKVFSNGGSSSGSLTSRDRYITPNSGIINQKFGAAPRISGNRAATSQIAQRLSAHMKVGTLQRTQSSSIGSKRPGSSFTTQSNIFKRR